MKSWGDVEAIFFLNGGVSSLIVLAHFLFVWKWITHPEVNLHYGDFVWANFNMTDRTSRRYMSATLVWRILSQELVETAILWVTRGHCKSCPDVYRLYKNSSQLLQWFSFQQISEFLNIYMHACNGPKLGTGFQYHSIYYVHSSRGTDWP